MASTALQRRNQRLRRLEHFKAKDLAYAKAHRKEIAERTRLWREKNPEHQKNYRLANLEQISKRNREWREAHPVAVAKYAENARTPEAKKAGRSRTLKYKYGIDQEAWELLFASQGKACAICHCTEAKWCTDHCHASGKVRGVLCHPCNVSLGLLKDNSSRIRAAAEYVERHA